VLMIYDGAGQVLMGWRSKPRRLRGNRRHGTWTERYVSQSCVHILSGHQVANIVRKRIS